ncbi:Choline kinase [Trachipleistophora hominis]|uniref:Choline kinase n=1 Tax=Trachipleistophora hominis TaxID=72359 RepID=L7JVN2_TRAHO|nr:Choline kinase [Trachipleistophora hominis]
MSQESYLTAVKVFLAKRGEKFIGILREKKAYSNLVYQILSNRNRYILKLYINRERSNEFEILKYVNVPKIYEMKSGYRIEEFLRHEVPDFKRDIKLIATALAQFHNTDVPGIESFEDMLIKLVLENQTLKHNESITNVYNKLKYLLEDKSMDGLIHMDLQVGNMLKIDNLVRLIDFEYSCTGSIILDIANFFCETMTNYQHDSILLAERGFNVSHKKRFLEEYLKHNRDIAMNVEEMYARVEEMQSLSHFFWFLWGRKRVFMNDTTSDCFDYVTYSLNRLSFLECAHFGHDISKLREEILSLGSTSKTKDKSSKRSTRTKNIH